MNTHHLGGISGGTPFDSVRAPTALSPSLRRASAFTLIEMAIALAVVAIGIMALFALMSSALDSSATAMTETHAGTFADDTLSTLRAYSLRAAQNNTSEWTNFWNSLKKRKTWIPVAAVSAWPTNKVASGIPGVAPLRNSLRIYGNDVVEYLSFTNVPAHAKDPKDIVNHALRYRLKVDTSQVANSDTGRVNVTLWVWPGEFGRTDDTNAIAFYAEYDNPGNL